MTLRKRKANRRLIALLVLGMVVLAVACIDSALDQAAEDRLGSGATDTLILAETREFWTAPTLLAKQQGIYAENGPSLYQLQDLDVRVIDYDSGLEAKNAVVNRIADLGVVADTPLASSGFQGEDIRLLATYFESSAVVELVGRNGGKPIDPSFLNGRRIGFFPGTISEIYLERMIAKHTKGYKIDRESIRTVTFTKPNSMPDALISGDIDGFVGWEPLGIYARRELGDEVTSWSDPELYTVSLHLVTRPEVIETRRAALTKFLSALREAERFIRESPETARLKVEQVAKLRPGELEPYWGAEKSKLSFTLKLQPEEIVERLALEARWLIDSGRAPSKATTVPRSRYEVLIDRTVYDSLPVPS